MENKNLVPFIEEWKGNDLHFESRDEGSLYLTLMLLNYPESECREAVLGYRRSVEKGKISGKIEDCRHRVHLRNAIASLNA